MDQQYNSIQVNHHSLVFKTRACFLLAIAFPILLLFRLGVEHYDLKESLLKRQLLDSHKAVSEQFQGIYSDYLQSLRTLAREFTKNPALKNLSGSKNTSLWLNIARGAFRRLEEDPRQLLKFRMAYSRLSIAYGKKIGASLFVSRAFSEFKSPLRINAYVLEQSILDPGYREYNYMPSKSPIPEPSMKRLFPRGVPEMETKEELQAFIRNAGYRDYYTIVPSHPALYSQDALVNTMWEELVQLYRPVFRSFVFGRKIGRLVPDHADEIFQQDVLKIRDKFFPLKFWNRYIELYWQTLPTNFSFEAYEQDSETAKAKEGVLPHGIMVAMLDSVSAENHFLAFLDGSGKTKFLKPVFSALDSWRSLMKSHDLSFHLIRHKKEKKEDESKQKGTYDTFIQINPLENNSSITPFVKNLGEIQLFRELESLEGIQDLSTGNLSLEGEDLRNYYQRHFPRDAIDGPPTTEHAASLARKAGHSQSFRFQDEQGRAMLGTIVSSRSFPEMFYFIFNSMERLETPLRNQVLILGAIGFLIILFTWVLGTLLSHKVVDPILNLNQEVKNLIKNRKSKTLAVKTNNELGRLASHFHALASKVSSRIQTLNFLREIHRDLLNQDSHKILPAILNGVVVQSRASWGCLGVFDSTVPIKSSDYLWSSSGEVHFEEVLSFFREKAESMSEPTQFWHKSPSESSAGGILCCAAPPQPKPGDSEKKIIIFLADIEKDFEPALLEGLAHQARSVAGKKILEDVDKDTSLGREIQEHLLPQTLPDKQSGLELGSVYTPARQVGGDFLGWYVLAGTRRYRFFVGDVCGRDVGASLVASQIRARVRISSADETFPSLMMNLHQTVLENRQSELFVSLALCEVDLDKGRVQLARAGHCLPFYVRSNRTLLPLKCQGIPLGIPWAGSWIPYECDLQPGDCIMLCTNGIPMAENSRGKRFGLGRLQTRFQNGPGLNSQQWVSQLSDELQSFQEGAIPEDDLALLRIRWRGPES